MVWKAPHIIFGLVGIGIGFFSMTIPRRSVKKGGIGVSKDSETDVRKISYFNLIVFFTSAAALGLTYKGIMTFLPAYMGQNVQLSFFKLDAVAIGGTIATIALLSGAAGQYVAGRLVDSYKPEKLYFGAVVFGTIFVFLMAQRLNIFLVVSAVLYSFFYFSTQPIQNFLLTRYLPESRQGTGFGIHFFLTFGVGSTAAAVCGYLADHFGLESVFYAMGVCFIVSSCLAWVLLLRSKRVKSG
jgi:MFS family permease